MKYIIIIINDADLKILFSLISLNIFFEVISVLNLHIGR